jgi:alkylation response protein AidB-like acyl-CoA dehydrogenase
MKRAWLPRLATGEAFTTVGISQVTTSHQEGRPAMSAEPGADGGFRLRGFMPWASGADRSDVIVTAGVLADGRQILALVPRGAAGVRVEPPLALMALQCARTSRVVCEDVRLPREVVLRGPMEKVLAIRSTVKPMVVSSSGLGLAGSLMDAIDTERGQTPGELRALVEALRAKYEDVRRRLYEAAERLGDAGAEAPSSALRIEVNELVIRLALAALTVAKGAGYVAGHRVGRLLREAMFFLVWSAPDNIRAGTLERLIGRA